MRMIEMASSRSKQLFRLFVINGLYRSTQDRADWLISSRSNALDTLAPLTSPHATKPNQLQSVRGLGCLTSSALVLGLPVHRISFSCTVHLRGNSYLSLLIHPRGGEEITGPKHLHAVWLCASGLIGSDCGNTIWRTLGYANLWYTTGWTVSRKAITPNVWKPFSSGMDGPES